MGQAESAGAQEGPAGCAADPQDRLRALEAELALRGAEVGPCGWTGGVEKRLSTVTEETEDRESRQVPSRRSVNSYGDDEDQSSSSNSEDELVKQFEISASRSQSFLSTHTPALQGLSQPAPGQQHKFSRLHSDQEDGSTEPSDCEDAGRHGYQDPLSYWADERASLGSQGPSGGLEPVKREGSSGRGASPAPLQTPRPTEEIQEAGDRGDDNNDPTDSSSTCSPEQGESEEPASCPAPSSSSRPPISRCGDLIVTLDYKAAARKLLVTVVMARDIPDRERSGMDSWLVHVVLLPGRKQRFKTAVQKGTAPCFGETFRFSHLERAELALSALRLRLYALGKMAREHMMGESVLRLGGLSLEGGESEVTVSLEPRSDMKTVDSQVSLSTVSQTDSVSSTQSLTHGGVPELLLGLAYNATTGRLSVELIKGSHFRNLAVNRPPDTYGKLSLLNSLGQEISRCKTSLRRGQPNPVYKETFVFQVALFQLSDVTLMVSIYSRRPMKRKEMVGWVSLGQNSSGEEEQLHWQDMKEGRGQPVCRWHVLLES